MKKSLLVISFFSNSLISCSQDKIKASDACYWVSNQIEFEIVQKNAMEIITSSEEDCIFALIDKLVDSVKTDNGNDYLQTLSAIRKVSDGYVSEYFDEVGLKLFYDNFDKLFNIIYSGKSQFDDPLEKIVIRSLGINIADAENPEVEKENLEKFIERKAILLKLDSNQKKYLTELKQRILLITVED